MSILNPRDISTLPWYYDEFGKYFIFIFNLSKVIVYIIFSLIVICVKLKIFSINKLLGIVLRIIK